MLTRWGVGLTHWEFMMRIPPLLGACALLIGGSASAVTMDWTVVGNAGNAADVANGKGAVAYDYRIGTYEVTNAQYSEFLNAKAQSDPLALYSSNMAISAQGGITRQGSSGSFSYSPIAGRESMPVNFVTFFDALRFVNWMNNGQGAGDTETGAYTLLGGTATPSNPTTVTRNAGAAIVLASGDEWYKAAYHDAVGLAATDYFTYPAGSNTATTCTSPTASANSGNCNNVVADVTAVGSYTDSASPYGTFDQGGNVREWVEDVSANGPAFRPLRGGSFSAAGMQLSALNPAGGGGVSPIPIDGNNTGFRVAMAPEPNTGSGLAAIAGMLGLLCWRRPHT